MQPTLQRTDLGLYNKIKLCALMLQKYSKYVENSNGRKLTKILKNQKQNQLINSLEMARNIDTVGLEALDDTA